MRGGEDEGKGGWTRRTKEREREDEGKGGWTRRTKDRGSKHGNVWDR